MTFFLNNVSDESQSCPSSSSFCLGWYAWCAGSCCCYFSTLPSFLACHGSVILPRVLEGYRVRSFPPHAISLNALSISWCKLPLIFVGPLSPRLCRRTVRSATRIAVLTTVAHYCRDSQYTNKFKLQPKWFVTSAWLYHAISGRYYSYLFQQTTE